MNERSSGGTACERCPSTRGLDTGPEGAILGYDYLCRSCLHELVPENWPSKGVAQC